MINNVKCDYCGKEFYKEPYRLKSSKNNFCSTNCHDKFRSDKKIEEMSEKVGMDFEKWLIDKYVEKLMSTRQIAELLYGNSKNQSSINKWLKKFNIPLRQGGEAVKTQWINNDSRKQKQAKLIQKNITKEVRLKIKNTMQTKEYKEKQREVHLGVKNGMYRVLGSNHHNWNPARTHQQRVKERKTYKYREWRLSVFKRDKYTCQCCGDNKGGNLRAHHLRSYDLHENERYNIDNGITLCEICHKDFHNKYGYGNNTEEQFKEYIKTNIK